ncbi:MAG: D-alanyl-D-alanine carboxypeptidase family protein [Pseudomonadota bacterium]
MRCYKPVSSFSLNTVRPIVARFSFRRAIIGLVALAFTATATSTAAMAQTITTPAEFAIIMDYETGATLFEKNADIPTAPASMSKLMTVAVVFEKLANGELSLNDEFSVSEKAWRMGGSKMWVRVDTNIRVEDLLRGVVVQSGNDACIVLAENIAGSEEAFADLMNRKAREWGLNDSTFANASGWPDPDQKMSMRDLAKLSRKIIAEYPEFYTLFSEREFTWEKITQPNRNPILGRVDGADGLKTGHTEESGFGLVGSALNDKQRRIVVLNGLPSDKVRRSESGRLMRLAFSDFIKEELFASGASVGSADVFGGRAPAIPLVVKDDVSILVHRSERDDIKATIVYEGPVPAPVQRGDQLGYLRVTSGENTEEHPLFAGESVERLSALGRILLGAKTLLAKPEKDAPESDS